MSEASDRCVDTSVLIAALSTWHEHHEEAARNVARLLDEQTLVVPQQTVIEAYSVLTRLPAPHRLVPTDALRLLSELPHGIPLTPLSPEAVWPLLEELASVSIDLACSSVNKVAVVAMR